MGDKPCQLIEECFFTEQVASLADEFPRIYEVIDGQYLLCRDPRLGTLLPGEESIYIWLSWPVGPVPSFRMLYAHDDHAQILHLLAIAPVRESPEDPPD